MIGCLWVLGDNPDHRVVEWSSAIHLKDEGELKGIFERLRIPYQMENLTWAVKDHLGIECPKVGFVDNHHVDDTVVNTAISNLVLTKTMDAFVLSKGEGALHLLTPMKRRGMKYDKCIKGGMYAGHLMAKSDYTPTEKPTPAIGVYPNGYTQLPFKAIDWDAMQERSLAITGNLDAFRKFHQAAKDLSNDVDPLPTHLLGEKEYREYHRLLNSTPWEVIIEGEYYSLMEIINNDGPIGWEMGDPIPYECLLHWSSWLVEQLTQLDPDTLLTVYETR